MSLSLHTNFGTLKIELFCEEAPESCLNFLALAAAGQYDGTIFHKSVPGFILQGGDPLGTGKGGRSYLGTCLLPKESSALQLKHAARGVVSLACGKTEPSVGSQFFITYAPVPHLDGEFPVIGRVIEGLDILTKIEAVPVSRKFRPETEIKIDSVHIHANPLAH